MSSNQILALRNMIFPLPIMYEPDGTQTKSFSECLMGLAFLNWQSENVFIRVPKLKCWYTIRDSIGIEVMGHAVGVHKAMLQFQRSQFQLSQSCKLDTEEVLAPDKDIVWVLGKQFYLRRRDNAIRKYFSSPDVWATFMRRGWQREISLSGSNAHADCSRVQKDLYNDTDRPSNAKFSSPFIGLWWTH